MSDPEPDERAFIADLKGARFRAGVDRGDWRVVDETWAWPNPILAVAAPDRAHAPAEFALRFTVDHYPTLAPTAAPWDADKGCPLAHDLWPTGGRVAVAFNPSWNAGAIYIPCDRQAISGHDGWLQQHRAYLWDQSKDIVDYLRLVHELLHSPGYTGVRRAA